MPNWTLCMHECMLNCFNHVHLFATLCMNCSLPGSSVHGSFQARIQDWVAISSSRGPSPLAGSFFTTSATWEAHSTWRSLYLFKKKPKSLLSQEEPNNNQFELGGRTFSKLHFFPFLFRRSQYEFLFTFQYQGMTPHHTPAFNSLLLTSTEMTHHTHTQNNHISFQTNSSSSLKIIFSSLATRPF